MKRRRIRISENSSEAERVYSTKIYSYLEEQKENHRLRSTAKKIREREERRFLLYGLKPEPRPEIIYNRPNFEEHTDNFREHINGEQELFA